MTELEKVRFRAHEGVQAPTTKMSSTQREEGIVIVGGGISGLATALALRRKNLNSLVLERSDTLRAAGAAIAIYTNGWRALDQLGVGDLLRQKAILIQDTREIYMDDGVDEERIPSGKEELRCVKRSDLIETLAGGLPPETIQCGHRVLHVETDPRASNHVLHLDDGSAIIAKVVIGCDGVNSIVAKSLQLKEPRVYPAMRTRGYTYYEDGQPFGDEFVRKRKNRVVLGRLPIDDRLVYWFAGRSCLPEDLDEPRDPKLIREATLKAINDFPTEDIEMVKNTDLRSINLTGLRYRAPWDVLSGLHKGTITVAGDAMHAMIPYLGQGGSVALEDAIVLARCMAQQMDVGLPHRSVGQSQLNRNVEIAFGAYVKQRRMRTLSLLTQAYLGESVVQTKSVFKKFVFTCLLRVLFGGNLGHAQYDCGTL